MRQLDRGQIRRNLKGLAKRMLKGGHGMALLVLAMPVLISLGFAALDKMVTIGLGYAPQTPIEILSLDGRYTMLTGLLGLASFALVIPMGFGLRDWFVELTSGNRETLGYAFGWFGTARRYFGCIGQSLLIYIRTTLWALLFFLPAAGAVVLAAAEWGMVTMPRGWRYIPELPEVFEVTAAAVGIALTITALCVIIGVWLLRYSAAPYILIRHPDKGVRESIKDSIAVMKGHKLEYFIFNLSFAGWFLLTPFTLGLLLLWLVPYFMAATALYFQYVEDAFLTPGYSGLFEQNDTTREFEQGE